MSLKVVAECLSSSELNMGCAGDKRCVGGLETVPRFLLQNPRLMVNRLMKAAKLESSLQRNKGCSLLKGPVGHLQGAVRRQVRMGLR